MCNLVKGKPDGTIKIKENGTQGPEIESPWVAGVLNQAQKDSSKEEEKEEAKDDTKEAEAKRIAAIKEAEAEAKVQADKEAA